MNAVGTPIIVAPSSLSADFGRLADEVRAAVTFQLVWSGGAGFGPQLGYAVCERGTWKVARDTYGRVLALGGVSITPPPPSL